MRDTGGVAGTEAIARWRAAVLDRLLLMTFLAVGLAVAVRVYEQGIGADPWGASVLMPGWLLIAVAAFRRSLSQRVRSGVLFGGLLLAIAGAVSIGAFLVPNAFVAGVMLSILGALLLGRRAAWLLWGVCILVWIGFAGAFVGGLPAPAGPTFEVHRALNWVRIIVIYAGISAAAMGSVIFLVTRMESATQHAETLLEALTAESEQRVAALQEQRALESRLQQSQKLEALGTLAGGVAHDFNNLLVVILNSAEMAAADARDPAVRRASEDIVSAAERATALTRQLLAFSRKRVQEPVAIDVDEAIRTAVRLLERLLPASVEVRTDIAPGLPAAWGPPSAVEQILINLCVNARDAMPDGGVLRIRAAACCASERRDGPGSGVSTDCVWIGVHDDGTGMDGATLQRLFEPFFTTKPPGQGTGLGLSMVHGLVTQCGGSVEVSSTPGEGSRFDVYLPVHAPAAAESGPASADAAGRCGETLLVVDDDEAVRRVLVTCLDRAGYRVLSAADGEGGLSLFRAHAGDIALVVSDAIMPRMGAQGLHDGIVGTRPDMPFLICSGYTADALAADFFEAPGRSFLAKPYRTGDLLAAVRALLDGARAARAVHPGG